MTWCGIQPAMSPQVLCKSKDQYRFSLPVFIGCGKAVPLQAWSGPEGSWKLRFPYFMTTAQDGGKVVSLTNRPSLPPGNSPGTHFCYRLRRPQGHSAIGRNLHQWKIPMTPAGIEPATFRFVAQHLSHCATAVPIDCSSDCNSGLGWASSLLWCLLSLSWITSLNIRDVEVRIRSVIKQTFN